MELQLTVASGAKRGAQELIQDDDQVLSVEQSLQLVKIFLNSSIACVCYTRELLRWTSDCLRTRYIEQVSLECDNPDQIYDNFLNARSESPTSSQQVRVLVRSQNARANCILDMLEYGVFDAIKSTYLDTLQVFVAGSSSSANSVLETYTFHFEYKEDRVTGVRLGETEQPFTLSRSQKSFKAAIRGLLRATQELPRLPKPCVLGLGMSYKDGCPDIYEPLGFTDASTHNTPHDWDTLWATPTSLAASFDSTHHNVKVATARLQSFHPTSSQLQDTLMSKQLQNMQKTSSSRNHALQSTVPADITPDKKPKDAENNKALRRGSERRRETARGITTEFNEQPGWPQSEVWDGVGAQRSIEVAAADGDFHDHGPKGSGAGMTHATPRRRKKSISKTFVVIGGSTPVSQRYSDETASEDGFK